MKLGTPHIIALFATLALAGCGSASEGDVREALEQAWSSDRVRMAQSAGVEIPGGDPGAMRGIAGTVRVARDLATDYAGDFVGDIADGAINEASKLASDFGIEGADEARQSIGVAMAKDWTVRNLEILSERESGEDYAMLVRYDLAATVNGQATTLAKDVTHQIRLIDGDDGWEVGNR